MHFWTRYGRSLPKHFLDTLFGCRGNAVLDPFVSLAGFHTCLANLRATVGASKITLGLSYNHLGANPGPSDWRNRRRLAKTIRGPCWGPLKTISGPTSGSKNRKGSPTPKSKILSGRQIAKLGHKNLKKASCRHLGFWGLL